MTKMKGILFVAAFTAFSSIANAGAYIGAGASVINYDVSGVDDTNVGLVNVVLGSNLTENVALEIRVGTGLYDGEFNYMGYKFDISLDKYVGVYTKLGAPINNNFYPYVIIGYSQTELEVSAAGYEFSDDDGDINYGLGFRMGQASDTNLSVEYIKYYDKNAAEMSGLALSITSPF